MTTKPIKRKFINYEENSRWARSAYQASLLHDRIMDGFRVFNGLGINVGTRAVDGPVSADGIALKLYAKYMDDPKDLPIKEWIIRNFDAQFTSKTNLIDKKVLVEMRDMFLAFLNNPDLEIAETVYKGPELMVRSKRPLPLTTPLNGLEFICFPVPELEHTPFDIKFNEEYTFTDTHGKGNIQLGPASLLNHHCNPAIRNVEQFGKQGGKLGNRGSRHLADKVMTFKPTLTRSVGKEELLIDYGENFFGQANRKCKCSASHARPITLHTTSSGVSSLGSDNRAPRRRKSKRVLRPNRVVGEGESTTGTTTPAAPSPCVITIRSDASTSRTKIDGNSSFLTDLGNLVAEDEVVSMRGRSPSVDMDLDCSSDELSFNVNEEKGDLLVVKATDRSFDKIEMSRAQGIDRLEPAMLRSPDPRSELKRPTPGLEFQSSSPTPSEQDLYETTPESPTAFDSANNSDNRLDHRHSILNGNSVIEQDLEYYDYELYGEIRPEREIQNVRCGLR